MPEEINHPPHYGGDTTYEVIKVIEAWGLNFSLGNAVKYIARAGKKTELPGYIPPQDPHKAALQAKVKDLQKAQWYLTHELEKAVLDLKQLTSP